MDVSESLDALGLNESEKKVFLELLKKRHIKGSSLASAAGVPRTKVYFYLKELVRKGLVAVISGRPLLYNVKSVDSMVEERKRQLDASRLALKKYAAVAKELVIFNYYSRKQYVLNIMKYAKVLQIGHCSRHFYELCHAQLSKQQNIKLFFYPGEEVVVPSFVETKKVRNKTSFVYKGKNVPATYVIVDRQRVFQIIQDLPKEDFLIREFLYEEEKVDFLHIFDSVWDHPNVRGGSAVLEIGISLAQMRERLHCAKDVCINSCTNKLLELIGDVLPKKSKLLVFNKDVLDRKYSFAMKWEQARVIHFLDFRETPATNVCIDGKYVFNLVYDEKKGRYFIIHLKYEPHVRHILKDFLMTWRSL